VDDEEISILQLGVASKPRQPLWILSLRGAYGRGMMGMWDEKGGRQWIMLKARAVVQWGRKTG